MFDRPTVQPKLSRDLWNRIREARIFVFGGLSILDKHLGRSEALEHQFSFTQLGNRV